jgi:hypothetical protein
MGSRLGRPNRDKVALREMAAQHGVDVVELQVMICRDLAKTYKNEASKPRSRRSKQFFDAEEKLMKVTAELTPYFQGKLSNVTVTDETPRMTVIRVPEQISNSQEWLEKYRPKPGDAPAQVVAFAKNLKKTLDIANDLGIQDVKKIVSEAKKRTDEDKP